MPESVKEGETGLPEGSDIGLGCGDRTFESCHSDQTPLKSTDFRGVSYSLFIAAQGLSVNWMLSTYSCLFRLTRL